MSTELQDGDNSEPLLSPVRSRACGGASLRHTPGNCRSPQRTAGVPYPCQSPAPHHSCLISRQSRCAHHLPPVIVAVRVYSNRRRPTVAAAGTGSPPSPQPPSQYYTAQQVTHAADDSVFENNCSSCNATQTYGPAPLYMMGSARACVG